MCLILLYNGQRINFAAECYRNFENRSLFDEIIRLGGLIFGPLFASFKVYSTRVIKVTIKAS